LVDVDSTVKILVEIHWQPGNTHVPERVDGRNIALNVYALGTVDFEAMLALQRRLVYEVSGERDRAALIVCEHTSVISVGRHGSSADIHFDRGELRSRGWPVRRVNRGGGCVLHAPGQLALYGILALDRLNLDLGAYLTALRSVLHEVALDAGVHETAVAPTGVLAGGRALAHIGVAVRDWVSYFGAVFNVNPDLELFRRVDCLGSHGPMTSVERERRLLADPAFVRQRLIDRFRERFDLPNATVFQEHPDLPTDGPLPLSPRESEPVVFVEQLIRVPSTDFEP
jgi:lipoyl(octanoyl) transferase